MSGDPVAVPFSFAILDIANAWGIPPWQVVSSDEPTDAGRRRWLALSLIRRRLGV